MNIKNITYGNFKEEVLNSERTVLLDFWADWCGPCRMLSPTVDLLAEQMPHIKVGKVNIDEQLKLAEQFKIMSIPTLVVLKGGKVIDKKVGVQSMAQIKEMLEA